MEYVKEKFYIILEDEDVIKSHGYTYEEVYNDLQRAMNHFYVPCVKDGDYYYFKQTEEQFKCFAMDSIYLSLASLKSLAGNIKIIRHWIDDEIYSEENEENEDYLDVLTNAWKRRDFL